MKHGHTKYRQAPSGTYRTWDSMRQRCTNPKQAGYANYGGRGVICDPRWNDFAVFLADMGVRPDGMTLDRIDNGGNYSPGNCRWASRKTQANNRTTNRFIMYEGETLTMTQWAERLGIKTNLIWSRMRLGLSFQEAIANPPNYIHTRNNIGGKRFGRLTVIGYHDTVDGRARWNCRCDCGGHRLTTGKNLKNGSTTSCGCARDHVRGESSGQSKLTEDQVREIRTLGEAGWTQQRIAGKFHINRANVSMIVSRKTWAHIK